MIRPSTATKTSKAATVPESGIEALTVGTLGVIPKSDMLKETTPAQALVLPPSMLTVYGNLIA